MSEAIEILKSCDAFLEGHFLLSSGRHSSAYCQMAYLQQYPDRCAEVMAPVAAKIKELGADVIVGPAPGGVAHADAPAPPPGRAPAPRSLLRAACGATTPWPACGRRKSSSSSNISASPTGRCWSASSASSLSGRRRG